MAILEIPAAHASGDAETQLGGEARRRRARDEQRLFQAWLDTGDLRARAALAERFMPLARSLARRYQRSGEPFDDLVQVASVALVKAIDRYDPARGCAFSSFAVPTIAGELKRHFRDHSWTVRPPRDLQEVTLRVENALTRLTQQLDRSPTTRELAAAADLDEEQVLEALQARRGRSAVSLQAPQGEPGDGLTLGDTLGIEDQGLVRAEQRAALDDLLKTVPSRAREMVRLRFEEDLTQAEIGAVFGVSQMQVSRILRQTIAQLREVAERAEGPRPGGLASLTG
ncbi:MAG TPA: SigB/SigF/SigG family RNA polymerase sigma factor [Solirubrobacteraceae bacterium]|nr:SigB/SigF/SigG family RNA polymerase sigma factor [Solirubrobacteraceae bacterium]